MVDKKIPRVEINFLPLIIEADNELSPSVDLLKKLLPFSIHFPVYQTEDDDYELMWRTFTSCWLRYKYPVSESEPQYAYCDTPTFISALSESYWVCGNRYIFHVMLQYFYNKYKGEEVPLFFKNRKNKRIINNKDTGIFDTPLTNKTQFDNFIDNMNIGLNACASCYDKKEYLEYLRYMLCSDLEASAHSFYLEDKPYKQERVPVIVFPASIKYKEEIIDFKDEDSFIDLQDTPIILNVWNRKREASALNLLRNVDFKFDPQNHMAKYYKGFNIVCVNNGNHTINAGRYYKKGTIKCGVIDVNKALPYISTDGIRWYWDGNSKTVEDVRFAMLYEILKQEANLP